MYRFMAVISFHSIDQSAGVDSLKVCQRSTCK